MTTKKAPAVKKAPATKPAFDSIESGKIIGASVASLDAAGEIAAKATEAIQAQVKAMREAKITIGKSRATCSVASAIYDAMATVKASTRTVYLSLIRKAVNETGKFSMNATRDAKKAKAKGAKATGGNIVISLASGAEAKDAAAKLRAGFNKMKAANDGLAKLAGFLIDTLDDAGFPDSE
jgi:hypothetical protein